MSKIWSLLFGKRGRVILFVISIYLVLYIFYSRYSKTNPNSFASKTGSVLFKPLQFGKKDRELGQEEISELKAISVSAKQIESKLISPNIDVSGLVDFTDKVDLYSKIGGRLEKIFVREGEDVSNGQKLFQVETLQMELELMKQQATLESSRSQVRLAREKYEKAKMGVFAKLQEMEKSKVVFEKAKEELEKTKNTFFGIEEVYKVGGLSKEEFETAKLNLTAKESNFSIAKRDLEIHSIGFRDEDIVRNGFSIPKSSEERLSLLKEINTEIEKAELAVAEGVMHSHEAQVNSTKTMLKEAIVYSPIKGVIAKRYKNEGELLSSSASSQPALTVVNIDKVYAVFNITETESTILKKGMRVEFTADVFPDSRFSGKVVMVSPLVDQKAHTVEVRAIVDNLGKKLKPGMFIRANIVLGSPTATILVPLTALVSDESGKTSVFLVKDGRCFAVNVQAGKKHGDEVEITSGLQNNDLILLDKLSQLRDGMPVNPTILR
ncbi:efflux RND transporter periplasmic adaptor subunit [Leptospira semungkisensis]|uniref:Efflux RND transporter periplasmic adaptor subunit n=1 Tax=Leptospira semungkisensis TaxID=2484985 RepID=A0A4R9FSF6_9LEPT|nr:efflux RND transporter periplasmic adaptor subunit [Leptospira semungkisensis]TGK00827.1 efflux RND transporter periplasmic adaptor subunit [Leptospira semungkisensis]